MHTHNQTQILTNSHTHADNHTVMQTKTHGYTAAQACRASDPRATLPEGLAEVAPEIINT